MLKQRVFDNTSSIVIINADDFGLAASIDEGIFELLASGRISSVSVIINEENAELAAQEMKKFKQQYPLIYLKISIGLHFNLTRGKPLSKLMAKSKFAQNGKFHKSIAQQTLKQQGHNQELADQFRQQVKRFVKLFRRRPSHVDGHNHVHIYPCVAKAIASPLVELGIYKIRMPQQKDLWAFSEFLANNFETATNLYQDKHIIWPNIYLGTEDCGSLKASKIKEAISENRNNLIELMCHPGYPTPQGTGWTSMIDRLKEKQQLQSKQFIQLTKQIGGLSSYLDLQAKTRSDNPLKLLIYSKLQVGTGNYTTSLRYKAIFEKMGFQVYTWAVQAEIQPQAQAEDLQKFLISFGISLILGINVTRSANIIHEATHSTKKIRIQVPYILVIAGTDANYSFQSEEKYRSLSQCLRWCQCIVSLSNDMTKITEKVLQQLKIDKNIYTIVQSSQLSSQFSIQKKLEDTSQQPVSNQKGKRQILFPTSFRRIKCVEHVFKQLNELIQKYDFQIYVLGPIIQQDYYEKIKGNLGKIHYPGTLSQAEYSKRLLNAFAIINCSQSQGMSCSILEALQFGVPVIARNNAGNSQLIKHNYNGLLYEAPEDFMKYVERLIQDNALRLSLIENGRKLFEENYSLQVQQKKYQSMIEKEVKSKIMELKLNGDSIRIFNQSHVHTTSQVNNALYLQISPEIKNEARILDFGCGTSVFSLLYLIKYNQFDKAKLFLLDINEKIIGNAIYNCRQTTLWPKLEITIISQEHFLGKVDKSIQFDTILFNPPQTPFQISQNRLDKNGGTNGIKFYEPMLQYFSQSRCQNLYILHSYLAWPSRVKQLLTNHKLKCVWKGNVGVHKIARSEYDKMESGLSEFILRHWRQGRTDIYLEGDIFCVPAELLLIRHDC